MQVDAGVQLIAVLALMFFGALAGASRLLAQLKFSKMSSCISLTLNSYPSSAAGSVPFFLRIKEHQMNNLAALGGGLLIGSALAVVIPEGFHSFSEVFTSCFFKHFIGSKNTPMHQSIVL